jgi:2-amino-4-hydroxy-6-hydroxymethyldihydropteridine diphosphokinase
LGANLGDARAALNAALAALDDVPGTRLTARSALYRTAPVGVTGQPDFINAVASIDTELSAPNLLEELLKLELQHGRTREFHRAPRTLDLDLLLYGDESVSEPGLTVPHPRLHERRFALEPLLDLDPALTIPGRGRVKDLLSELD